MDTSRFPDGGINIDPSGGALPTLPAAAAGATVRDPATGVWMRWTGTVWLAEMAPPSVVGDGINGFGDFTDPGAGTFYFNGGSCLDSTGQYVITKDKNTTTLVDVNASGVNGLDTGILTTDTLYAVYVIDGDSVTVEGLISLSFTTPTLPAGYTRFRRIGTVVTRTFTIPPIAIHAMRTVGEGSTRMNLFASNQDWRQILTNGAAQTPTSIAIGRFSPAAAYSQSTRFVLRNDGSTTARVGNNSALTQTVYNIGAGKELEVDMRIINKLLWYTHDAPGGDFNVFVSGYNELLSCCT